MSPTVSENQVLDALSNIIDPDLQKDIVSLGFVKDISIENGKVSFTIELTTPACPVKDRFREEAQRLVGALEGVTEVDVNMSANVRANLGPEPEVLTGVRNVIAIASGKGGVGKSTVAANLACALAKSGSSVGLLDADIYGPSAPIMFGIHEQPKVGESKITPIEAHGVHVMSLGFFTDERTPVIWRGPLVGRMIQQFLSDVEWGKLDYLVIDLPPGTGDAQLTLAQSCPISGAIIITTPQEVALEDVYRAIRMFGHVNVPVVGIVENMSTFIAPDTGKRYDIFRSGGGRRAAKEFKIPLLTELPINSDICEGGDSGVPIVIGNPESPAAQAYVDLSGSVAGRLSALALQGAGQTAEIKFSTEH